MAEQKNNSIERPNHAPVANAEVKERSALQKASRSFFAEDFNKVAKYVGKEIILPSVKRLIFDVFSDGLGALLWGTDSRKGKGDKFASYYGGSNRGSMYWQSGNSIVVLAHSRLRPVCLVPAMTQRCTLYRVVEMPSTS